MKTILKTSFLLSIVLFVFSCRQIPEDERNEIENISLGRPVLVKTNFQRIEWGNSTPENKPVSENGSLRGGGIL